MLLHVGNGNATNFFRYRKWVRLTHYGISNMDESPQTESSVLAMELRIRPKHVDHGQMRIT